MLFVRKCAVLSALMKGVSGQPSGADRFRNPLLDVRRLHSVSKPRVSEPLDPADIERLLSQPCWSVESLLPQGSNWINEKDLKTSSVKSDPTISLQKLHHLLRLCALPLPSSPQQEQEMLADLNAQLHFVRRIQEVDTSRIRPLQSLRDETKAAETEQEVNSANLKDAFDNEVIVGKWHPRLRRKPPKEILYDREKMKKSEPKWDVLDQAPQRVGRFFGVDSGET